MTTEYQRGQIEAHRKTHIHETQAGRVQLCLDLVQLIPPDVARLLELGSYNGMETKHLVQPGRQIVGVELGPDYLAQAEARGYPDFVPVVGDMHDLSRWMHDGVAPFDLPFDCVFANNIIEHAEGPEGGFVVLRGIFDALRPAGGALVGAIPLDARGIGVREVAYHTWKVDHDDLHAALLASGLVEVHWRIVEDVSKIYPGVHSPCSKQAMAVFRFDRP